MAETTIAWTSYTFNPWWGCTKVSPGCDNCYAAVFDKRIGGDHWGKGKPRRTFGDAHWDLPLVWNKKAQAQGVPAKVFCASMADVMDDEAPEGARERLWELIDRTPYLTWQLLTKRPQRYSRYLPRTFAHRNFWLGTTAENQENYNLRWGILRMLGADYDCPLWISYEPAIGPIDMDGYFYGVDRPEGIGIPDYPTWLVYGGESGAGRRPMERQWANDIMKECQITGTKFFMKQFGAKTPAAGTALIPPELLIREFPGEAD